MGVAKDYVNYKIATKKTLRCSTCDNFYPPSAMCEVVDGNISPDAVCDRYFIGGRRTSGKDKEYYKRELKKVGGSE
jgi:hypothetical protein